MNAPPDQFGATAFAPHLDAPPMPEPPGAPPPPPPPEPAGPPPGGPAPSPGGGGGFAPSASAGDGRRLVGFLVSYQDVPNGMYWPIYAGRNVVGRAETGQQVDIAVGHGTTSTHHAAIEADDSKMTIADLGSTNGTFHNEEAIGFQGKRDIRDGDRIRFGGFSVVVFDVMSRS